MLVWRGRGIVIALTAFGCSLAAELFTRARFHDENYYQQHSWPMLAAFWMAALIIWFLAAPYSEPPDVPLKDWRDAPGITASAVEPEKSSFRLAFFRPSDSLFFVPARFWPPILFGLGVLFYFIPREGGQ
jgi:hypothetical protein